MWCIAAAAHHTHGLPLHFVQGELSQGYDAELQFQT